MTAPFKSAFRRTGRVPAVLLLLVLAVLAAARLSAQSAPAPLDATTWQSGTVDLIDQWRARSGDNPSWARASFDDRAWPVVALADLGRSQPGWSWYRIHFKLAPNHPHEHLLLVGGEGVYAAWINGQPIADAGLLPWYALKRPVEQVIPLPDDQSDFTLALRTHAIPIYTIWHLPLFLTAAVGTADAIDNERAAIESQRLYMAIPSIAINLLVVLAGLAFFALFRSQSDHDEYLWLGLYLVLLGISSGLLTSAAAGIVPLVLNNLVADPLIYAATIMQIQFTFRFAGRPISRPWRIYQLVLACVPVLMLLVCLGSFSITRYILIESLAILPAALLLPVFLLVWYRRGNREAGWLILPSLLPAATAALYNIGSVSIFTGWRRADFLSDPIPIGPVALQVSDTGDLLFVLAIAIVMFFRFTRVSREQSRAAAELEAAREIQQRLVPAALPHLPGYRIEAAYFPAQEVGGDFYQVLPQPDGSTLLVLGDVSGKGLKAAMTGTLALGALRTLAAAGLAPFQILTALNLQLAGAAEAGFITCACVRLSPHGDLDLANAGHLPPYRDGEELPVAPDLPLGISPHAAYTQQHFHLAQGGQLTLLSDGVVEARDSRGNLYGFDRTRSISAQPAPAIAAAARRYGQEDDITVLTLVRLPAPVSSPIPASHPA